MPLFLSGQLSRRGWLSLAATSATLPWATTPARAAAPARASPIRLPPLPLRERRLGNGLQVISLANQATASVSIQVWYRVGSKDDPAGRSGFAHLFEHLMFKRTQHMPNEMFDRLTEDVGGQNNAFTAEDMTVYQNEVPFNHLERLLWAEAERLVHLQVDQASFESERKVVVEELRERVLADPYGRLFNALPAQGFEVHPYRRPGIGNEADLNAATLADVQQFHTTYYRPDNAVLVVVGDFDPPQLDAWVDRYFAPLRAPQAAIPRVQAVEPPRAQDGRVALTAPNVPLPAVALLWKGPRASHADAAALRVASALLSNGDSSRLNEALVHDTQMAQAVGFSADLYAEAGLLGAYAIAANGQPLAKLEAALLAQIQRLAASGPDAAEMDKVRTQLLTSTLSARQTPQGLADAIGNAVLLLGEARMADETLQRLQAVSAADVQRVLKQHVLQTRRMTVEYTQAAA
ncbi:MAG: insulinase family protein [Ideonella sp.]|nr:insulinase family protein [Ideonella sp.]